MSVQIITCAMDKLQKLLLVTGGATATAAVLWYLWRKADTVTHRPKEECLPCGTISVVTPGGIEVCSIEQREVHNGYGLKCLIFMNEGTPDDQQRLLIGSVKVEDDLPVPGVGEQTHVVATLIRRTPSLTLCPEVNAIVPAESKLRIRFPVCLSSNCGLGMPLQSVYGNAMSEERWVVDGAVLSDDALDDGGQSQEMFKLTVSRTESHEHIYLKKDLENLVDTTEEDELVDCSLVRKFMGALEGHIHQCGNDPWSSWGTIKRDVLVSTSSKASYTVYRTNAGSILDHPVHHIGEPALTAIVERGDADPRIRFVQSQNSEKVAAVSTDRGGWHFVECYPDCDILLVVTMLASMDRMLANTLQLVVGRTH